MSNAETNIAALRAGHDSLVALVAGLDDEALTGPSGASDWDISQVLSHLGSGAEISRAGVRAALDGGEGPGSGFNQTVWDRWNGMSPRERADEFPKSNAALVELYEAMDADTRENLRIDLGFLPAPVDVATAARMRLNEFALHSWDVRVAYVPDATLAPEAAGPLLHGSGDLLGWISKSDRLNGKHGVIQVTTTEPSSVFALNLADHISLDFAAPEKYDGTLALPAEAWVRLTTGRLAPDHTPAGVSTTGDAELELLREVFPGY
jgi:uncharacterized protein (TIGR03083 family)